jgi:hypothetical protein
MIAATRQGLKPRIHEGCGTAAPSRLRDSGSGGTARRLTIQSCSIVTTDANELMRPHHDRMPVILDPKDYATWLDQTPRPKEELLGLLRAFLSEAMKAVPVSTAVNNPRNQGPCYIERLEAQGRRHSQPHTSCSRLSKTTITDPTAYTDAACRTAMRPFRPARRRWCGI